MTDEKNRAFRVLIPEELGEEGLMILREAPDVEADIKTGLGRQELLKIIGDYDAIITRSGTSMDKPVIDAAKKLKVIARAGVGVDNVDIQEASKRGIVVINAPTGNTLAAAEQTMALMLAMVRHIPQAHRSVTQGEWERKCFMGRQLNGKKILIVGLGRIGAQVGIRCRAFGMEVMGYDPYVSEKKASDLGFQKMTDLTRALSIADIVTVHVPITSETNYVLNKKMIHALKQGSYIINCARGDLVDEEACAQAIREGRLAGAAFDVFSQEPPSADNPLFAKDIADRVVLTPHLGASTVEAQTEVARIAVTNTLAALRGKQYDHAVNLPFMEQYLDDMQKSFVQLARKMGILAAKVLEVDGGPIVKCQVMLRGSKLIDEETSATNRRHPYTVAVLKGLLEVSHGPDTNYMIAPILAEERGIAVEEAFGESKIYRNLIEITVTTQISLFTMIGTITEEGRLHIVRLNDYRIDFEPNGQLLIFQNHDRPGVVGKIGSLLGQHAVNIASFSLGRKESSGMTLAVMQLEGEASPELITSIKRDTDMLWAVTVKLDGEAAK